MKQLHRPTSSSSSPAFLLASFGSTRNISLTTALLRSGTTATLSRTRSEEKRQPISNNNNTTRWYGSVPSSASAAASAPTCDFLVVGGGVIGLNVAMELQRRHKQAKIILLEKEAQCGLHGSGRNSGVLHAGFYYTADSLKAKFTRDGNLALRKYIEEKGLKLNKCGKLVVARNEGELEGLATLLERGQRNGVTLEEITEEQAKRIEPRVKTFKRALWSPMTASADPGEVMHSLVADANAMGIQIVTNARYECSQKQDLPNNETLVKTSQGSFHAKYVVSAAGLYADKVAKDFGFSQDYDILPFKGLYLYVDNPNIKLNTNIYPVPNLKNPFLGVHYTVTVNNKVKIGPTAIPAFWREQYSLTDNFNAKEMWEVLSLEASLFLKAGFGFRELALAEMKKYYRPYMIGEATSMLEGITSADFHTWGKPGIRAQLVNRKDRKLVMDFVLEGDKRSFHVLNAVSPAWTCSIPFAKYTCDHIERYLQ